VNGAIVWSSGSTSAYQAPASVLSASGGAVSGDFVVFQPLFPFDDLVLSEPFEGIAPFGAPFT